MTVFDDCLAVWEAEHNGRTSAHICTQPLDHDGPHSCTVCGAATDDDVPRLLADRSEPLA